VSIVKQTVIENGWQLADMARRVLSASRAPSLSVAECARRDCDFHVDVDLDGEAYRLAAECKLRPSVRDVERLALKGAEPAWLLVTVRLTPAILDHCRRLGVNCTDLNGRLWLRARGLLVDRQEPGVRERFRLAEREPGFFRLKSSRLPRVLLSHPGRKWRQSELADATGLSQGLVSRLLNHAANQGWVDGARGDWQVIAADLLLDAWVAKDEWTKRVVLRQYSALERDFGKLARRLVAVAAFGEVAFTQWFAANLRFPYADPPVVSAYRRDFLPEPEVHSLGLREVADGGTVWVVVPRDAGVFRGARCVTGLPLACDVQIYLDLLQVGLRGPDQAEALRAWEGFCRT